MNTQNNGFSDEEGFICMKTRFSRTLFIAGGFSDAAAHKKSHRQAALLFCSGFFCCCVCAENKHSTELFLGFRFG